MTEILEVDGGLVKWSQLEICEFMSLIWIKYIITSRLNKPQP